MTDRSNHRCECCEQTVSSGIAHACTGVPHYEQHDADCATRRRGYACDCTRQGFGVRGDGSCDDLPCTREEGDTW